MGAAAAEEKAHRVRGRSAMESLGGCICSMRGGSEEGEGEVRWRGSGRREEAEGRGRQPNRVWVSFYTKQMQFESSVRR
jgi:hypothetical protein